MRHGGGKNGSEPRARIREREQRVVTLHMQGWTQQEIAAQENLSQPGVSKILRRVDKRAIKELGAQWVSHTVRRLRNLDYLSREARREWENSKKGHIRRRQKKAGGGSSDVVLSQEVMIDEHPDPRLLEQARKAEETILNTLGADAIQACKAQTAPSHLPDLTADEMARRVNALLENGDDAKSADPGSASPGVVTVATKKEDGTS